MLSEIYKTSPICAKEQIPSKDKRLKNCEGYFDLNVPEILIRKELPNELVDDLVNKVISGLMYNGRAKFI